MLNILITTFMGENDLIIYAKNKKILDIIKILKNFKAY